MINRILIGLSIGLVVSAQSPQQSNRQTADQSRPDATTAIVGRASIIDGDTIEVMGTRIRLHGIDAPEMGQSCRRADGEIYRCGADAANALDQHIAGRTVSCDERDVDRYGRIIAVCRAGGEDLNRWLVKQGLAVAYRRYSLDYVSTEDEAKAKGLGLWSGSFDMPEQFRHRRHHR